MFSLQSDSCEREEQNGQECRSVEIEETKMSNCELNEIKDIRFAAPNASVILLSALRLSSCI